MSLPLGGSKMESFTRVFFWRITKLRIKANTWCWTWIEKKNGKFFQVSFYDQNFIGRLVKLLDLINISPNSDVTKGVLARKPEPYIYIGDLTKIQRKPERSYSSKNTQRLLRSSISFWMSWGLLGSFCWHIKVEGFLFKLRPPLRNTKNWDFFSTKRSDKNEKHVVYPKLQFFGFHVVSRVGCWNTAQVLLADGRDGAVTGNFSAETSPTWSECLSEARLAPPFCPFKTQKINALQVRNIWIIYDWWFFATWFLGADKNHRPPYWSHEIIWNYGTPLAQQSRVIHGSTVNWK